MLSKLQCWLCGGEGKRPHIVHLFDECRIHPVVVHVDCPTCDGEGMIDNLDALYIDLGGEG